MISVITMLSICTVPQLTLLGALCYLLHLEELEAFMNLEQQSIQEHLQYAPTIKELQDSLSSLTPVIRSDSPLNVNYSDFAHLQMSLQEKAQERSERYHRFNTSPMRYLALMEHNNIAKGVWQFALLRSPMHKLQLDRNFLYYLWTAIMRIRSRKADIDFSMLNSPMHELATSSDFKDELDCFYINYCVGSRKCYQDTPLQKLNMSVEFKQQLRDAVGERDERHKILDIRRKIMKRSLVLPELKHYIKKSRNNQLNSSPMRKFAIATNFKRVQRIRRLRQYTMMVSPMRDCAIRNRKQIRNLHHVMQKSLLMGQSPLRAFTVANKWRIHEAYIDRFTQRQEIRNAIMALHPVCDELKAVYPKHQYNLNLIRRFLARGVPLSYLANQHVSRISVTFPVPGLANKFLSVVGLDSFVVETLCKENDIVVERCVDLFPTTLSYSKILGAVESTEGMTGVVLVSDQRAVVQVFSDVNTVKPLEISDKIFHSAIIRVIRRDHARFTVENYKHIKKTVERFIKQQKLGSAVMVDMGFIDTWLSKECKIILSFTSNPDRIKPIAADLIVALNMVKDIIFASLSVETCWINI